MKKLSFLALVTAALLLSACDSSSGGGAASSSSGEREERARASSSAVASSAAVTSGSASASSAGPAAASAAPLKPSIPAIACTAQGDKATLLGDFDGVAQAAVVDPARLFWLESTFLGAKEARLRSVAKDGSDPKLLAKWPGVFANALAVEGEVVYVTVERTLSAVPRDGGAPRELATEVFGTLAVRDAVVYTFRHDAGAKQDQLVAIAATSGTTVLASWPRTREFPDVWSAALDSEGKLLVIEPDAVSRIDPASKEKQAVPLTKLGRPWKLHGISNRPIVRGEQVAFASQGLAPRAGGELSGPSLEQPIAFLGHSLIGIEKKHDDIAGAFPAAVVQASTSSDTRRVLRRTASFNGALAADDACVYVINAARGEQTKVEAYAISAL